MHFASAGLAMKKKTDKAARCPSPAGSCSPAASWAQRRLAAGSTAWHGLCPGVHDAETWGDCCTVAWFRHLADQGKSVARNTTPHGDNTPVLETSSVANPSRAAPGTRQVRTLPIKKALLCDSLRCRLGLIPSHAQGGIAHTTPALPSTYIVPCRAKPVRVAFSRGQIRTMLHEAE